MNEKASIASAILRRAGTLPPDYGQLVNLTYLSAGGNRLSGAHGARAWLHACLLMLTHSLAGMLRMHAVPVPLYMQVPFQL